MEPGRFDGPAALVQADIENMIVVPRESFASTEGK